MPLVFSDTADPRVDLTVLDKFKQTAFVPRYPTDRRVFYAPVDDCHGVLAACIAAAKSSLLVAMFGFDDDALGKIIMEKVNNENVNVTLVLDRSQSKGAHETKVINAIRDGAPNAEVVIGDSERHAIMHIKGGVIDGCLTFNGSTNWSHSGQALQDNQLTVDIDPYIAIEATHRIQAIRLSMLRSAGRSVSYEPRTE